MTNRKTGRLDPRLLLVLVLPAAMLLAPLTVTGQGDAPKPSKSSGGKMSGKSGDGFGGYSRSQPLTDEQLKLTVEVLKEIQPELGQQMDALGQKDPEELRKALTRISPRVRWLVYQKMHDPEGYEVKAEEQKLQLQATELAHRIRDAEGQGAGDLKAELQTVLDKHFEARTRVVEHELLSLEKRIGRLREDLKSQREQKDQVIADRMNQLLTEGYLGFGPSDGEHGPGPGPGKFDGKHDKSKRTAPPQN